MNRFFKALSAFLAVMIAFSLAACEGEKTTDYTKNELVGKILSTDLSEGVFTASVDGAKRGYEGTAYVSGLSGESGAVSFDLYFVQYDIGEDNVKSNRSGSAVYLRGTDIYGALQDGQIADVSVTSSDYETEIINYINANEENFGFLTNTDDVIKYIENLFSYIIVIPEGYSEYVAPIFNAAINSVLNSYVLASGEATAVYNGYRLSIDIVGYIKESLDKLVELGAYIDSNPTTTLSELYTLPVFTDLFMPILSGCNASHVAAIMQLVNKVLISSGSETVLEVPDTYDDENGYEYLGRVLETKVNGFTVGAQRFTDVMSVIAPSVSEDGFESSFSKLRSNVIDIQKIFTDTLKLIFFFDTDMTLTRISADFNLKKSDYIYIDEVSSYSGMHAKVNFYPQGVTLKSI